MTSYKSILRRTDLEIISSLVEENSSVLDLGCGDGTLLLKLKKEKNIIARGVDISEENIIACITKGISVFQGNLDEGLADYADKSFDYVVLSQTLQVVKKPRMILNEALRVGKKAIISIPNFGYYKIRLQILFKGKMPKLEFLPYEWYETPNIRLMTLKDIKDLFIKDNIKVEKEIHAVFSNGISRYFANILPNLFAQTSVFLISKDSKTK